MATILKPKKITALPEATILDGSEYFPISQGGVTRKILASVISDSLGGGGGGETGGVVTEYVDQQDLITLNSAKAYADAQDQEVLNQAIAYTDANSGAGGVSQSYVDTADATTLDAATSHSDSALATSAAATLVSAQTYADSKDVINLAAAKTYSDGLISGFASTAYVNTQDTATLNAAKAYADAVGGGSGTYTTGGSATDLAPDLAGGSWTSQGTNPPVITSGVAHFTNAGNLSEIRVGAVLKDNTTYTVAVTMANYVSGAARVVLHGPTAGHQGATTAINSNGVSSFQITTTGTSSLTNLIRIQATGSANPNTYDITDIVVSEGSGGVGVTRPVNSKIREIETSVIDYGADPTGVADSTNAFAAAISSGAKNIHVPAGTYKIVKLLINENTRLYGDGRSLTIVNVTTTTDHGVIIQGDADYYANGDNSNHLRVERIQFRYSGTGQAANKHGIVVRVQCVCNEVFANNFTGSGWITDSFFPGDNTSSVFFAQFNNCWSKNNGLDGFTCRFGANANIWMNCKFDKNARYGFYHITGDTGIPNTPTVGANTYCNLILGGQCSYNFQQGWRFEDGECRVIQIYAEGNGRSSGGVGYVNTPYDVWVSDSISKSYIEVGSVNGPVADRIRVPTAYVRSVRVSAGGTILTPMCAAVPDVSTGAASSVIAAKLNELLDELRSNMIIKP